MSQPQTRHWIIVPTRNNLHLLRKAIETFRRQDIGNVEIFVINNGSSDNTAHWLMSQSNLTRVHHPSPGLSVAASWNKGLQFVFEAAGEDHALVVNNDVELRSDTYRHLLEDGGGFVTAVGVRDYRDIQPGINGELSDYYFPPDSTKKSPHPDFSCFLIRRDVYRTVGPFDEGFKVAFCEDWDYHVRLHQAGIRAECLDLPFLHHGSQTIKNCEDAERIRITQQAELNREYFFQKWGVRGGSDEYYELFNEKEKAGTTGDRPEGIPESSYRNSDQA